MNNRNMLAFVVLSIALLLGYNLVMTRLYPQPDAKAAVQATANPPAEAAKAEPPAPKPEAPAAPAPAAVPAVDPSARFTLATRSLKLTWRTGDGALVQAAWPDGTLFFTEPRRDDKGAEIAQAFPGIGAAMGVRFVGEPVVGQTNGGQTVTFSSPEGHRLVYNIPNDNHILEVSWLSPTAAPLLLVAKPATLLPVHGLGRVFTLDAKGAVNAATWTDMLQDPFFKFLGAKRKQLPEGSARVGLDAGLEKKKTQTNWYFAAIWDASAPAERDPQAGYLLRPGQDGQASARLYLGPKQAEQLLAFHPAGRKDLGKAFVNVVDFGFFGLVAKLLFTILRGIHQVVPNWGWSILLLTLLIRGVLWPLNTKTTVQMLRMKDLEPHQKAIQAKYEKFGNDMTKKAEQQKELMAFFKKNGHNPMGGCLPMVLQMPVFFALWSMLNAVFELRHAPFHGYLVDLSAADPYYILPILMGGSMIVQQAMTPAVGDPMQRKMMMVMMPVMFTFFFASTPSGLCLYYLMFNLIGILQTWIVMRGYKPQPVVI